MKTQELFNLLKNNQDKSLLFEYAPDKFVGANYHITEVKHVSVDAIDCGSNADSWNETIIQLWESPNEIDKTDYLTTNKALSILNKVGVMKPYDLDAEVKVEYSNDSFNTAQLYVSDYDLKGRNLVIKLAVEKTDCKAKSDCGVEELIHETVGSEEPCCSPDGNCC